MTLYPLFRPYPVLMLLRVQECPSWRSQELARSPHNPLLRDLSVHPKSPHISHPRRGGGTLSRLAPLRRARVDPVAGHRHRSRHLWVVCGYWRSIIWIFISTKILTVLLFLLLPCRSLLLCLQPCLMRWRTSSRDWPSCRGRELRTRQRSRSSRNTRPSSTRSARWSSS